MPLVRHMIAPLAFIALLAGCGDIQYAGSPNDCSALSARLSQIGIDIPTTSSGWRRRPSAPMRAG